MASKGGSDRGSATKTVIVAQGRRKVHTSFENGDEMVEEYDAKTDDLLGTSRATIHIRSAGLRSMFALLCRSRKAARSCAALKL